MPSTKRGKPNPDNARERHDGKIRKLYRRVLAEAAAVEDGAHPSSHLTDVQVRVAVSQAIADGDQSADLRRVLSGRFGIEDGTPFADAAAAVSGPTADASDRSGTAQRGLGHDGGSSSSTSAWTPAADVADAIDATVHSGSTSH